jgi:protein SCO1
MMNRIHCALFVAFALTLAGCNGAPGGPPPLEGAKMGGAFTLVNQNGVKVRDTDFAGQYRLIYFGYTFCPDVCPVDVQRLMKGFAALEKVDKAKAARIQPIFITIDPARDTPAALKQFVSAFHPRLIGLTGSAADVDRVAALYGVYFERDKPNASGAYMVNHSANAVLYGPKGQPVAIIAHDKGPEATADELARWVQ